MDFMRKSLFSKKSVHDLLEDVSHDTHGLKRSLGATSLVAMGVGAIIGAGIFVLVGPAAAKFAGPGIVISYIIAAFLGLLAALCYAEFSSLIPVSGSAYTYAYVSIGEFPAWLIGLALTLEYVCAFSSVAVGWSGYFVSLMNDIGINIPQYLDKSPLIYDHGWVLTHAIVNLPAVIIVGLIGFLVAIGIQTASFINNILVFIKLTIISLLIIICFAFIDLKNWHPFIPPNTGTFGEFGVSGILRGVGVVFFSFLGFDAVATLAQEARNPRKDLPIGMLGSLGVSTLAFIGVALILTGVVHYSQLDVPNSVAIVVNHLGPKFMWFRYLVNISVIASLSSVILVMLLAQTRIFYAMACDGLLPPGFAKIHQKYRTPFLNTIVVTIIGMIIVGFFPIDVIAQAAVMGALFVFGMVCLGILILRYTQPKLDRPFKTPLFPWVPILGTLAVLGQMFLMPLVIWLQLLIWMFLGCIVYFAYGRHNSKIRNS
jgi:APA family basic amino acid/polyamine antiporter